MRIDIALAPALHPSQPHCYGCHRVSINSASWAFSLCPMLCVIMCAHVSHASWTSSNWNSLLLPGQKQPKAFLLCSGREGASPRLACVAACLLCRSAMFNQAHVPKALHQAWLPVCRTERPREEEPQIMTCLEFTFSVQQALGIVFLNEPGPVTLSTGSLEGEQVEGSIS